MMDINETDVRRLYEDEGQSLRRVSKALGVSLATLSRFMDRHGVIKRNKAAAQKNFLKTNDHQMKGRSHTDATKQKISHGLGEFWESLTDKETEAIKKKIGSAWRRKWAAMSDNERKTMMESLASKAKEAQGTGSRLERYIAEHLKQRGYVIEERTDYYTAGKEFEVDLALPKQKIAMEIDGPTHFLPIHGEKVLQKQQERDNRKDMLILSSGYSVLRIRDNNGPLSLLRIDKIEKAIKEIIEDGGTSVWYIE